MKIGILVVREIYGSVFKEHNDGLVFATKSRGVFILIYYEACLNKDDAFTRERYLKSDPGKRYLKKSLKVLPFSNGMEKKKTIKTKKTMTLDGLATLIQGQSLRIDKLATFVKKESLKTDKFFTLIQGEFLAMQNQVDERFDQVDKRFDALEATNRSEHEEIRVRLRAIEDEVKTNPSNEDLYELDKRLVRVESKLVKAGI